MMAVDVKYSGVPALELPSEHEKSMVVSSAVCVKLFANDTLGSQFRKNIDNSEWIKTEGLRVRE